MRALFIGRFQPPHRGHLHALRHAHRRHDAVLVAIGSAQHGHRPENPFTLPERVEMLQAALAEARIERAHIYPLPDLYDHDHWVAYVDSLLPRYDVVVTHNPVNRELFQRAGKRVEEAALWRPDECHGSTIRRRWAEGQDATDLLPPSVARIARRLHGPQRVRALHAGAFP